MFSPELVQTSIMFMAAIAVGGIAYVFVIPFLSGERKKNKRVRAVASSEGRRKGRVATGDITQQNRRRQVQENLKELEAQKKANKKKLTLRTQLQRAGLTITPSTFHIFCAFLAALFFSAVLFTGSNLIVAAGAAFVGGVGLPRWILSFLVKRRQNKFLEEFANALDIIIRGVKSGLPLNDCINIIAKESAEPVRSEFVEVCEQQRVGIPLAQALDKMTERMTLPEVNFFAIVISIQQQAGGNLAEALTNLAAVLRDRKRLRGKVQAFSAEAKSSAAIIGSLPFVVMLLVYITTPGYIAILWEEKLGNFMLIGCGVWMLIGILIMRKMINFEY